MSVGLSRLDRVRGGLLGLLIADAVGVPYEFHPPEALPAFAAIDMVPPAGFARTYPGLPPGTWSDDGAQALCLLASLLACGRLDTDDLAARLRAWLDEGYLAVGGQVFDVGNQTRVAIERIREGRPAESCGPDDERSNGNGSLMRSLPLALWHTGEDAALVDDAMRQSRVTHGHPRSTVACALYCLWARRLLDGHGDGAYEHAVATLGPLLDEAHALELARLTGPFEPRGTGYVLDTVATTRALLRDPTTPYAHVVRAAIAYGHDTDTTACVAGGLAGVRDGEQAIPGTWRRALRGRELLDPLMRGLVERVAGG